MGQYLETGLAYAVGCDPVEMGRQAADEARSQLKKFQPSLAMVFIAGGLDVQAVNRGVFEVLGDCPTIGAGTAGEICNNPIANGVVVWVVAGPYLRVGVGAGHHVGSDFRAAVRRALSQAGVLDYFDSGHLFHQWSKRCKEQRNMGLRVVLADDETLARGDLKEMPAEMGHTIVGSAVDGIEALRFIEERTRTSSFWT